MDTSKNLIYGKRAIYEFIDRHPTMIKQIWTSHYEELIRDTPNFSQQLVHRSTNEKMERLFNQRINHQGYVAEIKEFNYLPFQEMLDSFQENSKEIVLVVDQIHDPYNFGAILRSATLLNVNNIIILDRKQVMVNSTVVKTSAGTAYDLNISKVNNLSNAINSLKSLGFWIYASNLNSEAQDIREVNFNEKVALIIGNEEKGISEKLTKNADLNIFVPSSKKIDSFNASVAASMMMYIIANKLKLI